MRGARHSDDLNQLGRHRGSWVPPLLSPIHLIWVGTWSRLNMKEISGSVRSANGVGRWSEREQVILRAGEVKFAMPRLMMVCASKLSDTPSGHH